MLFTRQSRSSDGKKINWIEKKISFPLRCHLLSSAHKNGTIIQPLRGNCIITPIAEWQADSVVPFRPKLMDLYHAIATGNHIFFPPLVLGWGFSEVGGRRARHQYSYLTHFIRGSYVSISFRYFLMDLASLFLTQLLYLVILFCLSYTLNNEYFIWVFVKIWI